MNNVTEKCRRKLRYLFVLSHRGKKWYDYLYPSYWHSILHKKKRNNVGNAYLTAGLNFGAGIGHQMTCWFDGYLLSRKWEIPYAHEDFFINGKHAEEEDTHVLFAIGKYKIYRASRAWNEILRLGCGEVRVDALLKQHYKRRMLPAFNPDNEEEVEKIHKIIASYEDSNVVFQLEIDQVSNGGLEYIPIFRKKFWNGRDCKKDCLLYAREEYNIAVHIRRGDVDEATDNGIRYNDNSYYVTALQTAFSLLSDEQYRRRRVYVFSEGQDSDFPEFQAMDRVTLCIGRSAKEAFIHFAYADLTIVSKSGFSCLGAMLNDGWKLYQKGMYFQVPNDSIWIPLDDKGILWCDRG